MRSVPLMLMVFLGGSMTSGQSTAQAPAPRVDALTEFVAAAQREPDLARGAKLFETCAACHGPRGIGTEDGEIPAIAGQHGSVLLKQLTDFRHQQRRDERMQYFSDRH